MKTQAILLSICLSLGAQAQLTEFIASVEGRCLPCDGDYSDWCMMSGAVIKKYDFTAKGLHSAMNDWREKTAQLELAYGKPRREFGNSYIPRHLNTEDYAMLSLYFQQDAAWVDRTLSHSVGEGNICISLRLNSELYAIFITELQ